MCLMCIEIAKEKMTINEARKALPEMIVVDKGHPDYEHYMELLKSSDEELLKKAKAYKPPVR